jgi:CRP-like cAMP-binding protein
MEVRSTLERIGLFAETLDARQIGQLAAKCHMADYGPGATLMTEGEFGTFMVAIVSGRLSVSVAGSRHPTRQVAVLGPGDIVGEMSLMTGARRSATVAAIEPARVVEITKVALESVFARAPELLDRFGEVLARRRAELDRIADDEQARRLLGVRPDEIVAAMRRLFARPG